MGLSVGTAVIDVEGYQLIEKFEFAQIYVPSSSIQLK